MNLRFFFLIALVMVPAFAFAGAEGHGGGAFICPDEKDNELMDFYEAEAGGLGEKIKINRTNEPVDKQVDTALKRLEKFLFSSNAFLIKNLDSGIRSITQEVNETLPVPSDGFIKIKKPGCELKGAALYYDFDEVNHGFSDKDLLKIDKGIVLPNTDQAGLRVHEVVFKYFREMKKIEHSIETQRLIAFLFSDQSEDEKSASLFDQAYFLAPPIPLFPHNTTYDLCCGSPGQIHKEVLADYYTEGFLGREKRVQNVLKFTEGEVVSGQANYKLHSGIQAMNSKMVEEALNEGATPREMVYIQNLTLENQKKKSERFNRGDALILALTLMPNGLFEIEDWRVLSLLLSRPEYKVLAGQWGKYLTTVFKRDSGKYIFDPNLIVLPFDAMTYELLDTAFEGGFPQRGPGSIAYIFGSDAEMVWNTIVQLFSRISFGGIKGCYVKVPLYESMFKNGIFENPKRMEWFFKRLENTQASLSTCQGPSGETVNSWEYLVGPNTAPTFDPDFNWVNRMYTVTDVFPNKFSDAFKNEFENPYLYVCGILIKNWTGINPSRPRDAYVYLDPDHLLIAAQAELVKLGRTKLAEDVANQMLKWNFDRNKCVQLWAKYPGFYMKIDPIDKWPY